MKCPWCNLEMEEGFVQGTKGNIFYTNDKRLLVGSDDNDIILTKNSFGGPRTDAYICRACKKIVIDYKKK